MSLLKIEASKIDSKIRVKLMITGTQNNPNGDVYKFLINTDDLQGMSKEQIKEVFLDKATSAAGRNWLQDKEIIRLFKAIDPFIKKPPHSNWLDQTL